MSGNSSDSNASRRDFFRSLFSVPSKAPVEESDSIQAMKRRASVLALRYAQNEAQLTQIGVEEPKRLGLENHLYQVTIAGYDPDEAAMRITLDVDIAKGVVHLPEEELDTED